MATKFGIFCRTLRIERGEILHTMATTIGVSSAFLSKVENGKKKPPEAWFNIITEKYNLDEDKTEELKIAIFEAQNSDSINISEFNQDEKEMMLLFARKINSVNREKFKKIFED